MRSGSLLIFGIKVGNLFLSLMVGIVLARVLGPAEYGVYSYIMAISGLLIIPAQFGFPTLVTREVAKADGDPDLIRSVILWTTIRGG